VLDSKEYLDINIIDLFKQNDGKLLLITLENNDLIRIWNIAWSYDIGDEYVHVTTNISPEKENESVEYFFTNEIMKISDSDGKILYQKAI